MSSELRDRLYVIEEGTLSSNVSITNASPPRSVSSDSSTTSTFVTFVDLREDMAVLLLGLLGITLIALIVLLGSGLL